MEISLDTLVSHFEDFLDATETARALSEKARDYRDHKQWTQAEVDELENRGQAPIVFNRISRKVNTLIGIKNQTKTDPKALPRTQKHEKGAEAITDALRYVVDNNVFDEISTGVFENEVVEGYGGAITEIEERGGELEVKITHLTFDRIYFDPHSRRNDFKDCKYMGIVLWMDQEDAVLLAPDKKDEIDHLVDIQSDTMDGTTFQDQPEWIDRKRKRIRICQHYFLQDEVWHVVYFTKSLIIIEAKESNYQNEYGEPDNPIELRSAYIDRDNGRYGEVYGMMDIQDEINHRRSKALHLLSTRQTFGNQGAIPDIQKAKEELSKADGHLEIGTGEFGKDFGILPTNDMGVAQIQMMEDAKAELDSTSANISLQGKAEITLSGKAEQLRQQAGMLELDPLLNGHKGWEHRSYRQIWNRIKQYWDKEKWVRVTDDESNIKWIGLNYQFTVLDALEEKIQEGDDQAQLILQEMMQAQDPRLQQVIEVRNNVNEMDVDIIIEDSPDVANIQQEQFELLANLIPVYGPDKVPFEAMVKLSTLRGKDEFLESLQTDPQVMELQNEQAQLALEDQRANVASKQANAQASQSKAGKDDQDAIQKAIETEILITNPEKITSVAI